LREVRPMFRAPRTFQRTVHRPARSASSTCASRGPRSRSDTVRPARAMSWLGALATRARAPAR
jgi:hypothetical protein